MADIDSKSIILWGANGSMGGQVKIHPRGSGQATIIEISLTYIGLENTDYWLGRARHEISDIFQKEFDAMPPHLTKEP
jgi:hypothetical protein